jgi:hypothetical protein
VHNGIGCCDASGILHYCSSGTMKNVTCTSGNVCGWNATKSYYGCVAPPGGPDPSNTYPEACP